MFGINAAAEEGSTFIAAIFLILFLAVLGGALATMVFSESDTQAIYVEERRAFYAAQSGVDYAVNRFLETDPSLIGTWQESIETGERGSCEILFEPIADGLARIEATGKSQRFPKSVQIDVAYEVVDNEVQLNGLTWRLLN